MAPATMRSSSAAGHNGLVCAAYLARAGKRCWCWSGATSSAAPRVTEEIFPGFRFSVFSYVVSLLRPEIIRDLDLPRHGLHILPLESTLTPLPNGDYLAQWGDHDLTRRELARHSLRDAEAYDEFGRLHASDGARGEAAARHGAARPDSRSAPRPDAASRGSARNCAASGGERFHALHKLLTMSSADYLDEWFETEALKATKSASGIIGTFLGPRSPGTAYVLLHHYMGEIDGVFRAWGFAKGGNGSVSEAIAAAAQEAGAEIRTNAPVAQRARQERPRDGRGARRTAKRSARRSSCRAPTRGARSCSSSASEHLPEEFVRGDRALPVPRLLGRRSISRSTSCRISRACPATARTCAARSRSARASTTSSARTTTRSTARSRAGRTWTS